MSPEISTDSVTDVSDTLLDRLRLATAGTYDVSGTLGRGGMAVVFIAKDLRLDRTVAIKVMEPSLGQVPGMAERFVAEARTLARLQHPNVIVVHDVQQAKGLNFFVMTLIEGGGVDELLRAVSPLPIDQAQWILLGAARALAFAHSERIVHRDVKPANILVNVKGDVVLTDFGIAKGGDSTGMTKSGTQIGTPIYMSPEQFTGELVGPPSDQYALGVTAYQLLTGAPPFTGELYVLIAAHGTRPPVPLRQLRPDCPAYLANAVMRMLEKRPEDRWPSLDDVCEVLATNLPSDGGATRKQLAAASRQLHMARERRIGPFDPDPPQSPTPQNDPGRSRASAVPRLSVTVSPPAATIFVGGTLELRATVTLENGQPVTNASVTWASSDPQCLVVDAAGRVTGVMPGHAVIRATLDGGSSEAQIAIEPAPIVRLAAEQTELTLRVGDTAPLVVVPVDVSGVSRTDVTLTWASRTPNIAEVPASGVVRALAPGRAVVDVSFGNLRQLITVVVQRRPVASVRIIAGAPRLELGESRQLRLEALDDLGGPAQVESPRWRSSAPGIVHVDSSGRALAIARGVAQVTVTVDDVASTIELDAVESPITAIELQCSALMPEVGDEVALQLRVVDTTGGLRSAESVRVWSSDASIAIVDEDRLVLRAIAAGGVAVYAQSFVDGVGGVSTAQTVQVVAPSVAYLAATPSQLDLEQEQESTIVIMARDRRGRVVASPALVWRSESPDIAGVSDRGTVRARGVGSGMIAVSVVNRDGSTPDVRIPVLVRPGAAQTPAAEPPPPEPVMTPFRASSSAPVVGGSLTDVLNGSPVVDAVAPTVRIPTPAVPASPVPLGGPTVPLPRPTPETPRAQSPAVAPAVQVGAPAATVSQPLAETGAATTRPSRGVVIAGVGLALVAGLWALASRSTSPTSIADPPPVTPLPPQPPAGGSDTVAPATPIDRTPERTGGAGSGTTIRLDTSTTANGKPTRDAKKPDEKKPDVKRDERTKVVVDSSKPKPEPVKPPAPTPTPAPVVPEPTPINKKQPDVKPTPDPTPPKPAPVAVVESIEDGEARTAVSGFIGTLAQPNANFGELATFLRDGNDPKFVLLNGPTTQTESGGRRTVQFIVKVTQFNAVGIQQTRRAMFSMDLTKSGGRVSWDKVRLISFVR